jgi:hypothetical protein
VLALDQHAPFFNNRFVRRLRDLIVIRAADTLDHTLSDEFVRRIVARNPIARRNQRIRPGV